MSRFGNVNCCVLSRARTRGTTRSLAMCVPNTTHACMNMRASPVARDGTGYTTAAARALGLVARTRSHVLISSFVQDPDSPFLRAVWKPSTRAVGTRLRASACLACDAHTKFDLSVQHLEHQALHVLHIDPSYQYILTKHR